MNKYVDGMVSVILPTYKRSDMLARAIRSVLCQTYISLELLVVNDNEPNDEYSQRIREIIGQFEDKRLFLIEQEKHINGAFARNVGIKRAKGEYIAFLDDDDYWEENKIAKQVNVLKSLPLSWGGVSCKIKRMNNDKLVAATLGYRGGYIFEDILLLNTDVATGTLLLRHQALDNSGYFDESLPRHQDLQLLVYFTQKYKIMQVNEYLHFADVSDNQNRPNAEKLVLTKKAFFKSVSSIMKLLPGRRQKHIYIMHDFELGYVMLKQGIKKEGIIKCIHVFKSPVTIYYTLKKITMKLISSMFRNILVE